VRCGNANELYRAMHSAIFEHRHERTTTDTCSARPGRTFEARMGSQFELTAPEHNVVTEVPIDMRWAIANALHFFSCTEEAAVLERYNRNAHRYLKDSLWRGAYGAIAMPQIDQCIAQLQISPHTRKAIVEMGHGEVDVNRPACWSTLHFMTTRFGLGLHCYQRSCSMSVAPFDLIVLTNVLCHVSRETRIPMGSLCWTFGSLHTDRAADFMSGPRMLSMLLPPLSRDQAYDALLNPESHPNVWRGT